jgi:hypothetical protein
LRDFQGVSEAGDIVVTEWSDENLGLMLEATKSLSVNNTVTITLKDGTDGAGFFSYHPFPR